MIDRACSVRYHVHVVKTGRFRMSGSTGQRRTEGDVRCRPDYVAIRSDDAGHMCAVPCTRLGGKSVDYKSCIAARGRAASQHDILRASDRGAMLPLQLQWWTQQYRNSWGRTVTNVTWIGVRVQGERQTVGGPCGMRCRLASRHGAEESNAPSNTCWCLRQQSHGITGSWSDMRF